MIKFGPSGNSLAFSLAGFKESVDSPVWVKNLNLDCFEYSFGRGVNMSRQKAREIGQAFIDNGVELSVHAPYFINFAGVDEEKLNNSYGYLLSSLEFAKIMGAKRVVFHPSTQGKLTRDEAVKLTEERLNILAQKIVINGFDDLIICPETMGKSAQIGTTFEIANFCNIAEFFYPAVDFGHVNSRTQGSLKSVQDYLNIFDEIESVCGFKKLNEMHVHFSKIMYGDKGEIKHLTFEDNLYGPSPEQFIEAVKIRGINPYVICESAGTQDIDAKYLKYLYLK